MNTMRAEELTYDLALHYSGRTEHNISNVGGSVFGLFCNKSLCTGTRFKR